MLALVDPSRTGTFQVPLIVLLVVGILAFAPWKRHPGWWLMNAGVLWLLLAYISNTFVLDVNPLTALSGAMVWCVKYREIGLLLFALGFAAMGAPVGQMRRRLAELDGSAAKPERKKSTKQP